MGAEARATLTVDGDVHEGTAQLESGELRFRGETRLRIALASITRASAAGGNLHVEHAGGAATFGLGDVAVRWLARIQNPRTLADKLGVKDGMRVAALGVDDAALLAEVAERGARLERRLAKGVQMVLWRITRPDDLVRLPRIAASIARDGSVWVLHPRGVAAVGDTVIFAAASAAGLVATKVARVSETDTAEKLVIPRAAR